MIDFRVIKAQPKNEEICWDLYTVVYTTFGSSPAMNFVRTFADYDQAVEWGKNMGWRHLR